MKKVGTPLAGNVSIFRFLGVGAATVFKREGFRCVARGIRAVKRPFAF